MSEALATTSRDALAKALHKRLAPQGEWPCGHAGDGYCYDLADALLDSGALIDVAEMSKRIRDVDTPIGEDGSLAHEYWRGYRAARNEVADLLRDPRLVQLPAERIDLDAEFAKLAEGSE